MESSRSATKREEWRDYFAHLSAGSPTEIEYATASAMVAIEQGASQDAAVAAGLEAVSAHRLARDRSSSQRRGWFNPRVLVLSLLTIGFAIASLVLYPRTAPPRVYPSVTGITLYSAMRMSEVKIEMAHINKRTLLSVDVSPSPSGFNSELAKLPVSIIVTAPPASVYGRTCARTDTKVVCQDGVDQETIGLSGPLVQINGKWGEEFLLEVPDGYQIEYPFAENSEYATAVLPSFDAFAGSSLQNASGYAVTTLMTLSTHDGRRFDWGSTDAPSIDVNGVTWSGSSLTGFPARIVPGVDEIAHASAGTSEFLSGALVGLAGAAFISLLVEIVPSRIARSKR